MIAIPWFASQRKLHLQFPISVSKEEVVWKVERINFIIHLTFISVIVGIIFYVQFFVAPQLQQTYASEGMTPTIANYLPILILLSLLFIEGIFLFLKHELHIESIHRHPTHTSITARLLSPAEEITLLTFLGLFSSILVFFYMLPLQNLIGNVY